MLSSCGVVLFVTQWGMIPSHSYVIFVLEMASYISWLIYDSALPESYDYI